MKVQPKEERIKRKTDKLERCQDLLEIARLVSWCLNRDFLIKTCLDHVSKKLGKPARCLLTDGEELKLYSPEGGYACLEDDISLGRESIIRQVVEKGVPVNLADTHHTSVYRLTQEEEEEITAIIPLWYVDSLTQEERRVGALVVNSGKGEGPILIEDFEYLKLVGELIGAAIGKAELAEELVESCRRKGAMLKETSHAFRNRIAAIGTFSQRLARLAKDTKLAHEARMLYQEVLELEAGIVRFEKYMDA